METIHGSGQTSSVSRAQALGMMMGRNMTRRSSSGRFGGDSYSLEEYSAARRGVTSAPVTATATQKQEDDAGFLEKAGMTVLDLAGNVISGAAKSLEGIWDFGLSAIGAIGGVFDKGFRDDMRRWVENDWTGENITNPIQSFTEESYLNDSKFGQFIENVASGVGQMLPTVALTIATGGTSAALGVGAKAIGTAKNVASAASLFSSAAGNATEEAFLDGGDYYRSMGSGIVSGAVEAATEKLFDGFGMLGGGMLDNVGRSVGKQTAAQGIKRVAKTMAQEGAEEMLSEAVSPAVKSIYKGRDALKEYGTGEYWQGVGEAGAVGAMTALAYGGTVGYMAGQSGKYADVRETVDDIKANRKKRTNLDISGKWTDAQEEAFHASEVANYRQIEATLKKASPKQRARMIAQNELDGKFDEDGSLKADFLRSLGENVTDGQMDAKGEKAAQSVDFRFEDGKDQADEDLVDFYQSVLAMSNPQRASKRKQGLGQVSQTHATLVSDVIKKETGKQMDVSDFEIIMDGSAVNHIEDRHGKNGAADKSMADMDNVARIPWAMNNATQAEIMRDKDGNFDLDTAYKNSDGSSSYKVKLERPIGNDRFYVVECAPDSARKQLIVKSAYIEKGSRGQVVTREADGSPYPTSETFHAGATDNSIPQNADLSTDSAEKSSGNYDHRYMSPDLWHRQGEVQREIAQISRDSGEDISVLGRELSDEGKKQYRRLKQAFSTLSEVSGGKLQMVVVEKNNTFSGAYAQGDTVYISADAVESGTWGEALIEESTHFAQGTAEHKLLRAFLAADTELLARVEGELTKAGNTYGFTAEDAAAFRASLEEPSPSRSATPLPEGEARATRYANEVTAHMSAELLSNEAVIDRLVGANATLAEKILIKFKQLKRAFSKDAALSDRVATAEALYLKAIERRGWRYENGKIVRTDEEEKTDFSMSSQSGEIALGMSEKARYEVLKDKKVTISVGDQMDEYLKDIQSIEELHAKAKSRAEKIIRPLAHRLGIFGKSLFTPDVEIDFQFTSNGGLKESLNKQLRYGGSYADLAKVIVNLESVLETATLIEKHRDKYRGTERQDRNLEMVYVLLGGVQDGQSIIPVQLEIKKHTVDGGRLYLTVALTKIEADVLGSAVNQNGQAHTLLSASEYSIADFVSKVNPNDGHFLKYLPDAFLSKEQISSKRAALEEDRHRIERYEKTYLRAKDDISKQQTSDDSTDILPKKKNKTKAEVLEDNARLRKQEKEARKRADERDDRLTLGESISRKVSKLKELRDGRMMASSEYKSEVLRGSVERLAQIEYKRTVTGSVRHIVKNLAEWYVQGNPLLVDENAYDEDIAVMMQEIALGEEGTELSFGEMHMLDDILGHLLKIDEKFNKVKKGGEYVDAKPYAEKYVRSMKNARKNMTGFVQIMRSKFLRAFGDPLSLVRAFDAYDVEGFWTETYQEFRQAVVDMSVMELDMMRKFEEFFEQNKGFEKHLLQSTVTYRGQELRFDEAASLYMTTKRKQAQRGLVESYYTVLDDKGNKHDAEGFSPRATGDANKLSDIQVATICKQKREELWTLFSEQERAYISMLEQIYEDMRDIKREADIDIKGFTTVSEKGYYFPIRRDQVAKEIKSKLFEVDRVSHLSINKAVVEGANAGLVIEPASLVLRRYARTLSLYANFSTPMENYNQLLNLDVGNNVKNPATVKRLAEERNDTKEMLQYIEKLAKDIQKVPNSDTDRASFFKNPIGFLRSGYAKFQLGLNLKTVFTQASSLFAASSRLDYSCILAGLGTNSHDVDKYCRLAEVRNSENTAALAAGVLETTGKIGDVLMKPIGWMDRGVVRVLFGACQQQIAKDQGLKVGTEENKVAAGELLQKVILDTQQNSMVTERADWMRSDDTWKQANMMFKADAVKVLGRVFDGLGEVDVLSRRLKNTTDPNGRAELEKQLKEARSRLAKSSVALVSSAVFTAIIAQAFRDLYAKDDDKDLEEKAASVAVDAFGNMLGALPLISDAAEYVSHGYEADSFMVAMLNDIVKSTVDIISLAGEAASGKDVSSQEIVRAARSAIYAVGQIYGIPVRNAYNLVTGLTSRVSPTAKYRIEDASYKQSYSKDLQAAIEAGDERMVAVIAGLMLDESIGIENENTRKELRGLIASGYDVLPRSVGETLTVDGEEYTMSAKERKQFKKVYGISDESVEQLIKLKQYAAADEQVRAKAVKFIYDTYYELAKDAVLGTDTQEKNVLFAQAIDIEKLAIIVCTARALTADKDRNGKSISGSKKAKVEKYVESLRLSAAQKHMVMGYLGYSNKNGKQKVVSYINTLDLSKAEKEMLLQYSGY